MNSPEARPESTDSSQDALSEWLRRLSSLVSDIRNWATELGWSTREIPKVMKDSVVGKYEAPGLILQKEFTKLLLEPIARSAPGAEGVVDLYLMPALDDIASIYYYNGGWQLHFRVPESPMVTTIREAESKPLTKQALQEVIEEMTKNAD